MPITITGNMTQEQIDQAMIADVCAMIASAGPGNFVKLSHRQASRLMQLLDASVRPSLPPQAQGNPGGPP